MQKYLIIGGAGFIGSHLSRTLLEKGNEAVVLDKRDGMDAEDVKKVAAVFKKEKPDFVIYLAGPIQLRKNINDPLFLNDVNFLSRINIILEACKNNRIKKFIFVSSGGALYENARTVPTKEKYPVHPTSLYGLANLMIEKYIQAYGTVHGLDFAIARLANAYGPGQWESGFVPAVILKMLKKESPVIYGSGLQTRDFIYIGDVVEALIILAQKGGNEIYNVGSGREISLNEMFLSIKDLLGAPTQPTYKPAIGLETQRSAMDIEKIKKEFGWSPKVAIQEGLTTTIQWYGK